MAWPTSGETIAFGEFETRLGSRELCRSGVRVRLPDQSFEVLSILLERRGELVTREEIRQRLWPGDTFVDFDHGLNNAVNRLREALGDSASTPRFLETLPRRGYRFIATVEEMTPSPVEPKPTAINGVPRVTASVRRAPFARKYVPWAAGVLLFAMAVAIATTQLLNRRDAAALSTRSSILIDPASTASAWHLSLSPDGKWLAFNTPSERAPGHWDPTLWVRRLDSLTARPIAGASGAFWSPDSRYIAFWDTRTLKIMEASGGYPVTVTDFGDHRGATWGRYDVILFAGLKPGPIYRVPAKGGTPEAVTRIESSRGEIGHSWPFFLPDGQHFLYCARVSLNGADGEANTIRVASLDGRTNKFLLNADSNATYAQGYLLFVRNHRLMAQPFDIATLSTTRDAVAIAEPIAMEEDHGDFDASSNGALVYRTGEDPSQLIWLDRAGKQIGSLANVGRYYRPRIAPDGRAVAVDARNQGKVNRDLWIYSVAGGTGIRLTSDPMIHTHPIWSPDGRRIAFAASAARLNERDLFVRNTDVDGHDELLLDTPGDKTPSDWSPDGRFLAYQLRAPKRTKLSLWILPLFGSREPFEFHPSAFGSYDGQFSPDGRWIAYTSDESGKEEVYVARFPEGGDTRKVSVNGGSQPRWRSDGRELFYLSPNDNLMATLMATDVQARGTALQFENVHGLFNCRPAPVAIGSVYDVSADGQRFLINTLASTPPPPPILITNWTSGLPH